MAKQLVDGQVEYEVIGGGLGLRVGLELGLGVELGLNLELGIWHGKTTY
jgi:hypothetical protein